MTKKQAKPRAKRGQSRPRVIVNSAAYINDTTIEVEVIDGLGGVAELWKQGDLTPEQVQTLDDAPDTIIFTVAGRDCYYVVAREASPSTNSDVMDVEGSVCEEVLEVTPPAPEPSPASGTTRSPAASPKREIDITVDLDNHTNKEADFIILTKKNPSAHYDCAKPKKKKKKTDGNGVLNLKVKGLPSDDTVAVVFMTITDDAAVQQKFVKTSG